MRVFLGGQGVPIPPIVLPDPNVADAAVPVILLPENGEVFTPADYVGLGYTHYEVWCVGAVGGQGASSAPSGHVTDGIMVPNVASSSGYYGVIWTQTPHQEYAPDAEWGQILQSYDVEASMSSVTSYGFQVPWGFPMPPEGVISWDVKPWGIIDGRVTPRGMAYIQHPGRMITVVDYTNPRFVDIPPTGGGGGGGGLQVVAGRLDELPIGGVPIVVGSPGRDAPPGQNLVNGAYDPVPPYLANDPYFYGQYSGSGSSRNLRESWFNRYPNPHPTFSPPGSGQDGGYSSFGGICMASGGKGGGPSLIWGSDGKIYFAGHGGDGGKGGRTAAGGGAQGALNPQSTATGKDGVWDPINRIGEGGGGGRGGMPIVMGGL